MGARRKRASFSQAMSRAERLRQLRRRRNSDRPPPSASLTNSLTPSSGVGLLASPCAAGNPGRAARGSVVPRKMACLPAARGETFHSRFKAINSRTQEGQPGRCPFLIGSRNGRQDARPCFADLHVAVLRRRRLDVGVHYFGFGLFCARWSRRCRHSREVLALTWTKTTCC